MEAFRQWAFSLCAAAMVCALIELLLPSISLAKMTRMALSVFFLCALIQPIGLELRRGDLPDLTHRSMEKAEEYAAEISGQIGEELSGSVEQEVEEKLAELGVAPEDCRTGIRLEEGQIVVTVQLSKDCAADPETVARQLEQDPMLRAEVTKEEP